MQIIYPMFAMVALTTIVGMRMAYVRIRGAYSGEVNHRYFRLMANYEIPERIAKYGRNFDNLFEVPVLFYAACVSALALNFSSQWFLILAWAFVGLRITHTIIHLTYNNPLHRFYPFFLSFICVTTMWINIVIFAHNNMS